MSNIQDLMAQRANIDRMISEAQREAHSGAVAKVKALMAEHGLTAADLSGRAPVSRAAKPTGKVAPKYRNNATGDTWTGRGLQPNWLKAALAGGAKIGDFTI